MSVETTSFDQSAAEIKKAVLSNEGIKSRTDRAALADIKTKILKDLPTAIKQLNGLRVSTSDTRGLDISLADYVKEKFGFAPDDRGTAESFFHALGLNPGNHSIQNLMSMPDFNESYRWLVPEIFRESVRLGLRKNPIYPNLIAAEESIAQPQVSMPYINMSDAMPHKIGEAETIPTGFMSFGQKTVQLQKVSIGLKITDEVRMYVPMNILSLYLQDVGVKMGIALDAQAIDVLINGDGNNNAAPVIGVQTVYNGSTPTTTGVLYYDLLRAWVRMGQLGRLPQAMLSAEDVALKILTLKEYTESEALLPGIQTKNLTLRTPVPNAQSLYIHGAAASNQVMLIDTTAALLKLNSQPLMVESERIAERQLDGTYATLTTGFATLFTDARLIIDQSLAYASYGFPSYMDVAAVQSQGFED